MHDNLTGTTTRKWLAVLLPFAVGLLGTEVYASLTIYSESRRPALGSLYYIPVVIAALALGARPALAVAVTSGAAHILATAITDGSAWLEPAAQSVLFVCVALTAARLGEWRSGNLGSLLDKDASKSPPAVGVHEVETWHDASSVDRAVIGMVRRFVTPLASIEGAGWVLESPQLPDEKRRELLAILRKETHRLDRLLSDLLAFAQPRPPMFQNILLSALIDDVVSVANSTSLEHHYTLCKHVSPGLPPLRGDPEQIRNVLVNIITNAIQATPGGGQIDILAYTEGTDFVIAVQDYGQGIPPLARDRIFEPFFTTHEHSLGLGLPTALRVVTDHGGRIAIDSERGHGTKVSVILPTISRRQALQSALE